jgi:hypothetical protein
MSFAEKAIAFYRQLQPLPLPLPQAVEVMNPYENVETQHVVTQFYQKYFADTQPRALVLGINPGRFGGGVTGISFTDPVNLRTYCGIEHPFKPKSELSSQFVYACIEAYGGAEDFYRDFYLGALYPLALVKDGKNYNYYDSPEVYAALKPEIIESLTRQAGFGSKKHMICLGQKNYHYLNLLNEEMQLFDTIHVLDHPRFIMQYRRKEKNVYIEKYLDVFAKVTEG